MLRRDVLMIAVGLQIGPYRLERLLGQGGMGSVWLARHAKLGHARAFKFLNPSLTGNPALVKRFENEAMATARLKHPGLVAVHNIDQLPTGEWFMELDFLEGKSLNDWLKARTEPVPLRKIVEYITQVCDCLAHVHRLGAVHRDLKPDNLFVVIDERGREQIKVLDLGVAQLNDDIVVGGSTQAGTVIGTVLYMAPEQIRGKKVTAQADIYALGVILYEMASGGWFPLQFQHETRDAYTSLHLSDMTVRHHTTMPLDLRMRDQQFPPAFAAVIMRAIDPDPARRQQNVTELARELQDALIAIEGTSASAGPSRADRYEIVKQLGEGGMAVVSLANMRGEHGFQRMVAIKRVLPELAKKPEFAKMFIAEAQLASRLNHSNIVSVLDFSPDSDGQLFLVMEYIHGADLATLIDSGPIPISLAIYIAAEMLRALAYVHQVPDPDPNSRGRGLVHRDISPHNVMLGYDGTLKLMDFGLARAMSASGRAITETVRGKVAYMAPEQSRGERPDGRVDLWAVGVILWEMLAGEQLFVGTTNECLGQLQFKDIPPPSYNGRQVPADVEAVVAGLLVRAPDGRYRTADEALRALLACRAVLPDARGELAALLAERIPDPDIRAAARTKKMQSALPPAGLAPAPRAVTNSQPQFPNQTTLRGAASERMSVAAPRSLPVAASKRNKWPYLAGGAVTIVGAAVAVFLVVHARAERPVKVASEPTGSAVALDPATVSSVPADAKTAPLGATASTTPAPSDAAATVVIDAGMIVAVTNDSPETPAVPPVPPLDAGVAGPTSKPRRAVARPAAPVGKGELVILVRPWAAVWIDGKESGQTPFRESISAGNHRLKLVHEDSGRTERTSITIKPGETLKIERDWQ